MRRREFLKKAAALTVWAVAGFPFLPKGDAMAKKTLPEPSPAKLPRWRGFNL
ncbi:glycoside hydrolase, partial [Candidatus Poribacteria bacterium]